MPRNIESFRKDIEDAIKESSKGAVKTLFDTTSNADSYDQIQNNIADKFSINLASELAPKLATIIDKYISDITVTHALISPQGPVTGQITLV